MKNLSLLTVVFLISICNLLGQFSEPPKRSNVGIYLHGGVGLINSISANVEFKLARTPSNRFHVLGRVGVAGVSVVPLFCGDNINAKGVVAGLTFLTGRKNSHLEINTGMFINSSDKQRNKSFFCNGELDSMVPIFEVGYRYQKPEGGLILRVTAGSLGLVGISIGSSF